MPSLKVRIRYSKEGCDYIPWIEIREDSSKDSSTPKDGESTSIGKYVRLPSPIFFLLPDGKKFDTIDAALEHGEKLGPEFLKKKYGPNVQYDLEVIREPIQDNDVTELLLESTDETTEPQDQIDLNAKIKALTRELLEKLKATKVPRKGSAANLLEEIQRVGVPLKEMVRMVRSLAITKVRTDYWEQEISHWKIKRSEAKKELRKGETARNSDAKSLEKDWDDFIPQKRATRMVDLMFKDLIAQAKYNSTQQSLANSAHVPLDHTNIANHPLKITTRYLCKVFKYYTPYPEYGLVGLMLREGKLLRVKKQVPRHEEYQLLRKLVRQLFK